METNKNIQEKIENTFKASETIQAVNVSPFFKDKTMNRLFLEKEEEKTAWLWFTPKLQLATLACVVVLNVFAISKLNETTYNENVSDFAESYGLSTNTESFLSN